MIIIIKLATSSNSYNVLIDSIYSVDDNKNRAVDCYKFIQFEGNTNTIPCFKEFDNFYLFSFFPFLFRFCIGHSLFGKSSRVHKALICYWSYHGLDKIYAQKKSVKRQAIEAVSN